MSERPGFTPGFAARHALAGQALQRAFTSPVPGFSAVDVRDRRSGRRGFAAAAAEAAAADPGVDPLAAAHAAGFAEGAAAALSQAAAAGGRDQAMLVEIGEQLRAAAAVNREALAARLRQTVMMLVARLVGEVGIDPERLAARVAAASELLADGAESALLRVNPADVALLEGRLPDAVFAVGDAAVDRGHFVLESASTLVEDGPELWLEQLAQAIDRVAIPA
jgi:flagellar assembly protein FliH